MVYKYYNLVLIRGNILKRVLILIYQINYEIETNNHLHLHFLYIHNFSPFQNIISSCQFIFFFEKLKLTFSFELRVLLY